MPTQIARAALLLMMAAVGLVAPAHPQDGASLPEETDVADPADPTYGPAEAPAADAPERQGRKGRARLRARLPPRPPSSPVSGVVFHDLDGDAARDDDEPGVPDVAVSNGINVVLTDADGRYTLALPDDDGVVFVIKPSGWQVPLDAVTNAPRPYVLHKPDGSPDARFPGVPPTGARPAAIDFPLTPHDEPSDFRFLSFGDIQPRDERELQFFWRDVIEELLGVDAAFAVTLGDLVHDDLDLLEPVGRSLALLGIPWYPVLGNHDLNHDARRRQDHDDSFERVFGTPRYAFNWADVHVIVCDMVWDPEERKHLAHFGPELLAFIANDLEHVPEDKLVVVLVHIPLRVMVDREEFLALMADRPHSVSFSGHWNIQESRDFETGGFPHHNIVQGTVVGSGYTGHLDEYGIPHAMLIDGVPNGYGILDVTGNTFRYRYKGCRLPADHQMNVFVPGILPADEVADTEVVVNVFVGDEQTTVRMRIDELGDWLPMERFTGQDPEYVASRERDLQYINRLSDPEGEIHLRARKVQTVMDQLWATFGNVSTPAAETDHLWRATLPPDLSPGYHVVHVHAIDRWGQEHTGRRVFRVDGVEDG